MPHKVDGFVINNSKLDKRVKLFDEQKKQIRQEYKDGGTSYNKLAKKYGVSKRLIIFIVNPDKLEKAKKDYRIRAMDGRYYDKEKHAQYIKKHRQYKAQLLASGKLKQVDNGKN